MHHTLCLLLFLLFLCFLLFLLRPLSLSSLDDVSESLLDSDDVSRRRFLLLMYAEQAQESVSASAQGYLPSPYLVWMSRPEGKNATPKHPLLSARPAVARNRVGRQHQTHGRVPHAK